MNYLKNYQNNIKMVKKDYLLFILISLLIYSSSIKQLKVRDTWKILEIDINGNTYKCPDCTPSKFKVSYNNTFTMCIPRIYNYSNIEGTSVVATFISLDTEYDEQHYWFPFPEENVVALDKEDYKIFRIFSVMGYDIDDSENYYLLDQGVIIPENNTIMENTTKLVICNKNRIIKKTYYFNYSDFNTSLLTDIAIDHNKKYAYILDSGILLNSQSIPRLIVLDLEKNKIYRILNNNKQFKEEENITLFYSENEINNYFTNITGLNNIQLSCDGKTIYFSSLKNNKLYKVHTKDILDGIKKYEKTNDDNYLNNINLVVVDKEMRTQSFIITSKNNIYMTYGEKGTVRISYSIDENLEKYNFKDYTELNTEKFKINWPGSLSVNKGKLFVLDNHYYNRTKNESDYFDHNTNETVGKIVIYCTNLEKDELSNIKGCSIYIFNFTIYSIALISIFLIITIIFINYMFMNGRSYRNSNLIEQKFRNEENVKELNRRLNE